MLGKIKLFSINCGKIIGRFSSKLADFFMHQKTLTVITIITTILWATNVITIFVYCMIIIAGIITFIGIARSEYIKNLPSVCRLFVLIFIAAILTVGGYLFGSRALDHYNKQKQNTKTQVNQIISKETKIVERLIPAQTPEIKFIFKDSPLLTAQRQKKITKELNSFRNYLIDIGFEVPKETPPFCIEHGKGGGAALGGPRGPVFFSNIYIGDKVIDNLLFWRKQYAYYIFDRIFDSIPYRPTDTRAIWIFTDYFSHSYANQKPTDKGINGWMYALWDIRNVCGQSFIDRSLFYMTKFKIEENLNGKDPNEYFNSPYFLKDFNKYFSKSLILGSYVISNDRPTNPKMIEVLKKYNFL